MRKIGQLARSVVLALFAAPSVGIAQSVPGASQASEEPGVAHVILSDVAAYTSAPLHWDEANWLESGLAAAAVGVAYHFDDQVRSHFTAASPGSLDGKSTNDVRDALPTAAIVVVTLAAANLLNEAGGRQEAYTMIEAGVFSTVTTELVKYAAGRERPNETSESDRWRREGSSFPSLHASAAFAVGTVLAESGNDEYRWVRRILGYGIAAATGYERVKGNNHWASDVVAGAVIGAATGGFLVNRRDRPGRHEYGWELKPLEDGAMLAWSSRF